MAFKIPRESVIQETAHWIINHRIDSALPGYLVVGARRETNDLSTLPPDALAELGPLLAAAQTALRETLRPEHIYVGRYGHTQGHSLHFHVIPIYGWVKQAFSADARYWALKSFYTPGAANSDFDGAELTLYVWREFCESKSPPPIHGSSVAEVIDLLRQHFQRPLPTALDKKFGHPETRTRCAFFE